MNKFFGTAKKGFSFVEILTCMFFLGLIAAMSMPTISSLTKKTFDQSDVTQGSVFDRPLAFYAICGGDSGTRDCKDYKKKLTPGAYYVALSPDPGAKNFRGTAYFQKISHAEIFVPAQYFSENAIATSGTGKYTIYIPRDGDNGYPMGYIFKQIDAGEVTTRLKKGSISLSDIKKKQKAKVNAIYYNEKTH